MPNKFIHSGGVGTAGFTEGDLDEGSSFSFEQKDAKGRMLWLGSEFFCLIPLAEFSSQVFVEPGNGEGNSPPPRTVGHAFLDQLVPNRCCLLHGNPECVSHFG